MVSGRQNVPCLFKRLQKRKGGVEMSETVRLQAELNELDEELQFPRLAQMHKKMSRGPGELPNMDPSVIPSLPEHFITGDQYEELLEHHNYVNNESMENQGNFTEYTRGEAYKTRRITQSERWLEHIKPMFLAYMKCLGNTSEWGDEAKWNTDWNTQCVCPKSCIKSRNLDTVDVLSRRKLKFNFCKCTPDQVRLIHQGFIGSSPINPSTAYSIRLLRLYQTLWKYCTLRIQPFCLALDLFLEASNPIILVRGSNKPRLWRRTFSGAVDAYRHMLRLQLELKLKALKLSPLEELEMVCSRCYGPPSTTQQHFRNEPDYIVSVDGNFQHRGHLRASREYGEMSLCIPSLFLHPSYVKRWDREKNGCQHNNITMDPCTVSHTAAQDRRTGPTWKGCDETGLMGMVCRHDHTLSFINVIQSGEKSCFAHALLGSLFDRTKEDGKQKSVGFLYDVGCNFEKGLKKHNLFLNERQNNQLKVGTGAFHSYAHNRRCQLEYNPRLNEGWGKSDGEGNERVWSDMDPLISATRCATKQHRLDQLEMKTYHRNTTLELNSAQSAKRKFHEHEASMLQSQEQLLKLEQRSRDSEICYSVQYFADQWSRQKTAQLELWADGRQQSLLLQVGKLVDLEENLRVSHARLKELQRKRCQNRSQIDIAELATLPASILAMKEAVESAIEELGVKEFGAPNNERGGGQGRSLIRVRVSKERLYEAKVGIVELQKVWDRPGHGMRRQPYLKKLMIEKQKKLRARWNTYSSVVENYNHGRRRDTQIPPLSFELVKSYPLENEFWNIGHLTQPDEPWAVDLDTKQGIEAYLNLRGCQEELRRIAHEVRQMMSSALSTEEKIKALSVSCQISWIPGFSGSEHPIKLVQPGAMFNETVWEESKNILKVIHRYLIRDLCKLLMVWNTHIPKLFLESQKYSTTDVESDLNLLSRWRALVEKKKDFWDCMVNGIIASEDLDDLDAIEHDLLSEGEDEDAYGGLREGQDTNEIEEIEDN